MGAGVAGVTEALGPALLARLPPDVGRPAYDRAALRPGMAHVGVGAFHRCHQAEFTDDMLAAAFGRWGVVGINVRPPRLAATLGAQDGLYTRLRRSGDTAEARVVGSIVRVVDSQDEPGPALALLASPEIDVVTMTVTEKSYCHRPADGALDWDRPEIAADLADPERPQSLPGLVVRALELRMQSGAGPVTLMSCDNIPANGVLLGGVVRALAERRGPALARWIAANAAFPSAMVDRISPATTPADLATVEATWGYRDAAVAVCEPFRQWVIEDRFAARRPPWDLAGATFVADVTPFEQLKMRVLNAAQSTLAHLGVLAGHEFTSDSVADPLLEAFVRRMLVSESVPTLPPLPGIDPAAYVDAEPRPPAQPRDPPPLPADRHRRLAEDRPAPAEPGPRAGLARAAGAAPRARHRRLDGLSRPHRAAASVPPGPPTTRRRRPSPPSPTASATTRPRSPPRILAIDAIFAPELAASTVFRRDVTAALAGLLSDRPMQVVARARRDPWEQVE